MKQILSSNVIRLSIALNLVPGNRCLLENQGQSGTDVEILEPNQHNANDCELQEKSSISCNGFCSDLKNTIILATCRNEWIAALLIKLFITVIICPFLSSYCQSGIFRPDARTVTFRWMHFHSDYIKRTTWVTKIKWLIGQIILHLVLLNRKKDIVDYVCAVALTTGYFQVGNRQVFKINAETAHFAAPVH